MTHKHTNLCSDISDSRTPEAPSCQQSHWKQSAVSKLLSGYQQAATVHILIYNFISTYTSVSHFIYRTSCIFLPFRRMMINI